MFRQTSECIHTYDNDAQMIWCSVVVVHRLGCLRHFLSMPMDACCLRSGFRFQITVSKNICNRKLRAQNGLRLNVDKKLG